MFTKKVKIVDHSALLRMRDDVDNAIGELHAKIDQRKQDIKDEIAALSNRVKDLDHEHSSVEGLRLK